MMRVLSARAAQQLIQPDPRWEDVQILVVSTLEGIKTKWKRD